MNKEHHHYQQLIRMGYINVTGLTCLSYGQDSMRFRVPSVADYPNQKHISGKDFIFLLLENGQTWFKKADLTIASRSTLLYYLEGTKIVAMDNRNPENTQGTVLVYPFEFNDDELEKRKLDPYCVIEEFSDVISSTAIMEIISKVITQSVENFVNRLCNSERYLKQFPNEPFLEAFNSILIQKVPVPDDHLKNFYIMVIIQAQIEGKFPYKLTHHEFVDLVEISRPPVRFKEVELGYTHRVNAD